MTWFDRCQLIITWCHISKKYKVNQGCMSLSTYYLQDGRHPARLHRRGRVRLRAIPLAMITTRKSIHGFPLVSYIGMGLLLGRRSSAVRSSLGAGTTCLQNLITSRAKLLNADWLRQRAFFLNQEGTFGNQEGMITWCWLAEHACIKLVSRFKRSLKRNFRNTSLLSLILIRSFHLNVKENQHATKRSHLEEKQKDFSDEKRIDSQRENSLSAWGRLVSNEALDRTSWPPNWKLS